MQHSKLKNAASTTNDPQGIPNGKNNLDVELSKKAKFEYFETSLYKS